MTAHTVALVPVNAGPFRRYRATDAASHPRSQGRADGGQG